MPRKIRQRARKGDGSVFQTKAGKWCASISLGSGAVRRKIRRFAPTESAATEALRRLRAEYVDVAGQASGETPTLKGAIDRWLADQKPRLRNKSYVTYEVILRLHVLEADPVLAHMRVDRIKPVHIRDLFIALEKGGRSPRVRELVFLRLHSIFAGLVGEHITRNPVLSTMKARVPRKTMNAWDQDEARAFLEATKNDWLAPLYRLALSVGMRRGELLALRWADVDLKTKRVHIQHTLSDDGKILDEPKTAGSRRTIELPPKAAEALVQQKKALLAKGLRASPWVFPTEMGDAYVARKVSHLFDDAMKAAAVRRIRFHDLRHTAATLRLKMGEHPKIVSEMLGHASVSITLDLYSHVIPSLQRESADRFDAVL